jgi:hypothetical protein
VVLKSVAAGILLAWSIVVAGGACGEGDVVERLCARADECNFLNTSVTECEEFMNQCTGDLTPSQRAEWEYEIEECLERPTCGGAGDCYLSVPWC